jgi:hypothetical protein
MGNIATNSAAEPSNSSAANTAITSPPSAFVEFLLAQFRCAALRSKLITNQIEAATVALSAGIITPETALLILHETGVEVSS